MLLLDDVAPFAVTLERTYDLGGKLWVKVPEGLWACQPAIYHKGGYPTWEIIIPGHSDIKFHKGNREIDFDGCIGVGERFHDFDLGPALDPGIGDSKGGFDELMRITQDQESLQLEVHDV